MKEKPMFEIILPSLPYKELNPNEKQHWAKLSKFVKAARDEAFIECQSQRPSTKFEPDQVLVSIRLFIPGDHIDRDEDNLGASMKAYQDGFFDYLRQQVSKNMNDSQIKMSLNVLLPPEEKPQTFYYLFPHSISLWNNRIPMLLASHGVFKRDKYL